MKIRILPHTFVEAACFLSAIALATLLASTSGAQDIPASGRQALEKHNFPWYDANSEEFTPWNQKAPGRAASLNRGDLPVYTPIRKQNNATAPTNVNSGFSSWFTILIWTLIGILFGIIIGALIWVFLKMEDNNTEIGVVDEDDEPIQERIKQLPFEIQQTTGDFRQLASSAAKQGQYGRATMLLFSHVLLLLDKKGLIRLRKGKTNRQYLRELKPHSHLSSYYQRVMLPFEDNFFGDHAIEAAVFEGCWQDLDEFQSQVNESLQAVQP